MFDVRVQCLLFGVIVLAFTLVLLSASDLCRDCMQFAEPKLERCSVFAAWVHSCIHVWLNAVGVVNDLNAVHVHMPV